MTMSIRTVIVTVADSAGSTPAVQLLKVWTVTVIDVEEDGEH